MILLAVIGFRSFAQANDAPKSESKQQAPYIKDLKTYKEPFLIPANKNGIINKQIKLKWNLLDGEKLLLGGLELKPELPIYDSTAKVLKVYSPFDENTEVKILSSSNKVIGSFELEKRQMSIQLSELKTNHFRYCIEKSVSTEGYQFCSPLLSIENGNKVIAHSANQVLKPKVILEKNNLQLKGEKTLNDKEDKFTFIFSNGFNLQLLVSAVDVDVKRVERVDGNTVQVIGEGFLPYGDVQIYQLSQTGFWSSTMGNNFYKDRWVKKVTGDQLTFRSELNIPLVIEIDKSKLPINPNRVKTHTENTFVTYKESIKVRGLLPANHNLNSQEGKITYLNPKASANESREFVWETGLGEIGKKSTKYIQLSDGKENWYEAVDVYRGFSTEISARLSLLSSLGQSFLFTNFKARTWFENLFGWDHDLLSNQHWGAFFRSVVFNPPNETLKPLNSLILGGKYRFQKGVVNWNESWGMALAYQSVTTDSEKFSMLGTGVFWERSLPKMFNEVFNLVDWFNYPKWVSAEILYFSTLDNQVAGQSLEANFEGKIYWTPQFFAEAGIGIRNQFFKISEFGYSYSTLFVTGGLGWQF